MYTSECKISCFGSIQISVFTAFQRMQFHKRHSQTSTCFLQHALEAAELKQQPLKSKWPLQGYIPPLQRNNCQFTHTLIHAAIFFTKTSSYKCFLYTNEGDESSATFSPWRWYWPSCTYAPVWPVGELRWTGPGGLYPVLTWGGGAYPTCPPGWYPGSW